MDVRSTASYGIAPAPHTGRRFYTGMGLAAIAFSVASFAPSLIQTSARNGPLTPLLALHGSASVIWLVLFVVQARLVAVRRVGLHRRVGVASLAVAALFVWSGYLMVVAMGRRGYDMSGDLAARADPLAALGFPLLDLGLFAVLVTAAVLARRRPAVHRRLMLLVVFGALMPAPIAHLTGHVAVLHAVVPATPILVALCLFAGALHDRIVSGRVHPVSLWIPLAIFFVENLCAVVVLPSAAWHRVAALLIR